MKKHTNLGEEIEGEEEEVGVGFYLALFVVVIGIVLTIADFTGVADQFINSFAK